MYIHDGAPLYLTADRSEVVEEGDERAAFLLVGSGGQLTDEEAEKYGLKGKAKAAENKARAGASENKAEAVPETPSEGPQGADSDPSPSVTFTPAPALEEAVEDGPKPKKGGK